MIYHLGIVVSDYKKSLAPLDYRLMMELGTAVMGTKDVAGLGEIEAVYHGAHRHRLNLRMTLQTSS